MATSSAIPANLEKFVSQATPASAAMAKQLSALHQQVEAYEALPSDYRFTNGDAIAGEATRYVAQNQEDERFVAGVRSAFLRADSTTLPDASIAATLKSEGVSTSARSAFTVDQPLFKGKPLDSGFSDDPVCTATGHFLEVDNDLVLPDPLRVLGCTRTYTSRFLAPTSLGRGWYCWADAQLLASEGGIDYTGPDGQQATFLTDGDAIAANAGVDAVVERRAGGGLRMRWRWPSRFPGMRWDFDAAGGLEAVHDPFGGTTELRRDGGGRLVTLAHEGGRTVDVVWDGGRLTGLRSNDGREVTYRHDSDDLVGVDRPAGRLRYDVDGAGHILTVTDADGVRLVDNTYDDEGRVLTQTSPFGRTSTYTYLAPRTVVVNDDDRGPSTLFRHDVAGRLVELVDAEGRRSSRSFDSHGNPVRVVGFDGGVTDRTFDVGGQCTYERRPDGSAERWSHDAEGRVVGHVDAAGAVTTWTYGDDAWPATVEGPLGARTTYESRHGLPTRVVDPDGVGVTLDRDPDGVIVAVTNDLGERTRFTPHPSGHPTAVELPTGEQWAYELDGAGRMVAEVSPLGLRTEWHHSSAGRLIATVAPDGTTTTVRRGDHGMPEAVVEPGDRVTTAAWDRLGNLRRLAHPGEDPWLLEYDPVSQLSGLTSPAGAAWTFHRGPGGASEGFTDPLGQRWLAEHDAVGRTTGAQSPLGRRLEASFSATGVVDSVTNDVGGRLTVDLDDAGRPLTYRGDGEAELRWAWSPAGRPLAATLPDGSSWRWRHDGAGRPVELTGPDGGTTRVTYDAAGRTVATTLPGGGRTEQRWDADGRLVEVAHGGAVTAYAYDAQGRVVAVTRPGTGPVRLSWDDAGRLVALTDPLGATTELRWSDGGRVLTLVDPTGAERVRTLDGAGRLMAAVDPLGRPTAIERDILGREIAVRRADGAELALRWDADGRLEAVAAAGRDLVVTGDVPADPPPDAAARGVVEAGAAHVVGEAGLADSAGTADGTALDGAARAQRTVAADGAETVVGWDRRGRQVLDVTADRRTSLGFDDGQGCVDVALPDGTGGRWHLDAQGRPTVLEHPAVGRVVVLRDGDGLVVGVEGPGFSRRWQRDGWGRVTGYTEAIGDTLTVSEIERDAAGRVVAETVPGGTRRYTYDAAGQLVACADPARTVTWTYDAAGRLTDEVTTVVGGPARRRRFTYDAADQLVAVDADGTVTRFTYDACGRRVAERGADGRATTYRWDALGRLSGVERSDAAGTRVADVVTDGLGRPRTIGATTVDWPGAGPRGDDAAALGGLAVLGLPGVPLATAGGDGAAWISTDWRGSAGAPLDPWGAPVTGDAGATPGIGYLGELCFEGLVWLRNRVYDPATRQFLSPDPLTGLAGYPGALTNPYTYAGNDPVGLADPLGLQPLSMAQANAQMKAWKQSHVGELVVGTLAIAGAVTLCVVTGGAATPLVVGAVLGGVLGGGGTVLTDELEHKPIDWWGVYMNAGVGAFMGAAGAGTASVAEDGSTTAIPSLLSKLPGAGPIPAMYTSAGTSFITSEAQNPTLNPTALANDGIGSLESAATAGALHYTNFPTSMFSAEGSSGTLTSEQLSELQETDPAKWWRITSQAQNANWAMAPKRTIAGSFAADGWNQIPKIGAPGGPTGGGPMTSSQLQAYVAAGG